MKNLKISEIIPYIEEHGEALKISVRDYKYLITFKNFKQLIRERKKLKLILSLVYILDKDLLKELKKIKKDQEALWEKLDEAIN